MPGWGLTVLLAEAIGLRRAKQMSTTGNFLDAATALTWGLVNEVVPHDELLPRCQALGRDIASVPAAAARRMPATYDEGSLVDGAGVWAIEGDEIRRTHVCTPDTKSALVCRLSVDKKYKQEQ